MENTNIRGQMNDLVVGAEIEFPLHRYEYVCSCRTRLQISTGKQFTTKKEKTGITVTRTL